jgi:hypothetical protein
LISVSLTELKKPFNLLFTSFVVNVFGNLKIIAPGCFGYRSISPKSVSLVTITRLLLFRYPLHLLPQTLNS